jgi:hypothetical protein
LLLDERLFSHQSKVLPGQEGSERQEIAFSFGTRRVAAKRDGSGRWPLETRYPGAMPVEIDDGEGRPSRWNTLRALRVLRWYEIKT